MMLIYWSLKCEAYILFIRNGFVVSTDFAEKLKYLLLPVRQRHEENHGFVAEHSSLLERK
jgi:hypothetical protein